MVVKKLNDANDSWILIQILVRYKYRQKSKEISHVQSVNPNQWDMIVWEKTNKNMKFVIILISLLLFSNQVYVESSAYKIFLNIYILSVLFSRASPLILASNFE